VERRRDSTATLTGSLYEYSAGFLWGGFDQPKTSASAVYQILLGFIVLILVSSYTANLAAFITVSNSQRTTSVTTILDAVSQGETLCQQTSTLDSRIDTLYPQIIWGTRSTKTLNELGGMLMDGHCDGLLMTGQDYKILRTNSSFCTLSIVQTVFRKAGGWFTNPESPCISKAISYGLLQMEYDHVLYQTIRRYLGEVGCSSTRPAPHFALEQENTFGRRLSTNAQSSEEPNGPRSEGRRLAAATAGRAAASSTDKPPRMTIGEFIGLIYAWVAVTAGTLLWTYMPASFHNRVDKTAEAYERRNTAIAVKLSRSSFTAPLEKDERGSEQASPNGEPPHAMHATTVYGSESDEASMVVPDRETILRIERMVAQVQQQLHKVDDKVDALQQPSSESNRAKARRRRSSDVSAEIAADFL